MAFTSFQCWVLLCSSPLLIIFWQKRPALLGIVSSVIPLLIYCTLILEFEAFCECGQVYLWCCWRQVGDGWQRFGDFLFWKFRRKLCRKFVSLQTSIRKVHGYGELVSRETTVTIDVRQVPDSAQVVGWKFGAHHDLSHLKVGRKNIFRGEFEKEYWANPNNAWCVMLWELEFHGFVHRNISHLGLLIITLLSIKVRRISGVLLIQQGQL